MRALGGPGISLVSLPSVLISMLASPITPPAVGSLHASTVKSVQLYGAFCSLEGCGRDGLLHISQLDPGDRSGTRTPSLPTWSQVIRRHHLS